MVITSNLAYAYTKEVYFQFPDLHINDNEDLIILGESGIGKTTLLHLLAGLLKAKTGTVMLNATDITQLAEREMDQYRGNHIGFVFQKPCFVKSLSVFDNLLLVQFLAGRKKDKFKAGKILEDLGIASKAGNKTTTLSQGERQRAGIAMAFMNDPSLILADEPTANLDDKNCQLVAQLLREQAEKNQANLLVITHDQRLKTQFENQLQL